MFLGQALVRAGPNGQVLGPGYNRTSLPPPLDPRMRLTHYLSNPRTRLAQATMTLALKTPILFKLRVNLSLAAESVTRVQVPRPTTHGMQYSSQR